MVFFPGSDFAEELQEKQVLYLASTGARGMSSKAPKAKKHDGIMAVKQVLVEFGSVIDLYGAC